MKHFTLSETTRSSAAEARGLKNVPNETQREALISLVDHLLDPLRDAFGEPIRVLSGYRSQEVNRLVGGVPTSQHLRGEAADLACRLGPEKLLQILQKSGLAFDQAIVYRQRGFLHLSYCHGHCRRMTIYK